MGEYSDKAKGKAKQIEGNLTGDRARHREGVADEIKGNLKGVTHKIADAAKTIIGKAKNAVKNDQR